jgi:dihydrofolate reductase
LPEDLKRFKQLTSGKPVIMGRLTYESIGKPLPDRRNIVLSARKGLNIDGCEARKGLNIDGCEVVDTPDAAIRLAGGAEEVMVIGGGGVYSQMLPMADRIYMTRINATVDGDTFFPNRVDFPADESRQFGFSFVTLDRI